MTSREFFTINDKLKPKLISTYYINEAYGQHHVHMLHKHADFLEILYVSNGSGRYIVGKREYNVCQGDIIICNANVLHGEAPFQQNSKIESYCIAINRVKMLNLPENRLIDNSKKPVFTLGEQSQVVSDMMKMIHKLYCDDNTNFQVINHLMSAILYHITDFITQDMNTEKYKIEQKKEDFIRLVIDYLDLHYTENIKLEQISKDLFVSPSTLSHVLKKETGLSPIQYMLQRKIGEAQSLLMDTDLPINEIEENLGFSSSCHFSATFKKYMGISPREFRNHFHK